MEEHRNKQLNGMKRRWKQVKNLRKMFYEYINFSINIEMNTRLI